MGSHAARITCDHNFCLALNRSWRYTFRSEDPKSLFSIRPSDGSSCSSWSAQSRRTPLPPAVSQERGDPSCRSVFLQSWDPYCIRWVGLRLFRLGIGPRTGSIHPGEPFETPATLLGPLLTRKCWRCYLHSRTASVQSVSTRIVSSALAG